MTLDTTRVDAIGPEARDVQTPAFNALAARGRRFRQAYATVPETLPSHSSMMTGLYAGGHGVHENARHLPEGHPVIAQRLKEAGYRTAAFVSAYVLAKQFGLARGFDVYDDEQRRGQVERSAQETTERAMAFLASGQAASAPLFLWVHYFDPHYPYAPPELFKTKYAAQPYLGEVAAMDDQLGRLVQSFERQAGGKPVAIAVAGDHGEGLGEHGEAQHGQLLYQATMHVPLVLVGPGVSSGTSDTPVSVRQIFHTVLDWAGAASDLSLRADRAGVVLGEAMKPFLSYGWQPQIMAVEGRHKTIFAGSLETYDVVSDPAEARNLPGSETLPVSVRSALDEYPVPSPDAAAAGPLDTEAQRKLASLGYIGSSVAPAVRKDAPRPADMTRLFDLFDQASGLFVRQEYAQVVPLLERILREDPYNLDAALRLATALSSLGQEERADAAFRRAAAIAPASKDVPLYQALHYTRTKRWERAAPLLERVVADSPERVPALEGLAVVRERQGRVAEAVAIRQKIHALRAPTAAELNQLGQLAMAAGQTTVAIEAFEKARGVDAGKFGADLELGVLYLAARRLPEAREALDRVPASHPGYPMALFKRAQVSVLLNEPDSAARIAAARRRADATTRDLIASERLFQRR